jgi:hypothetical protein
LYERRADLGPKHVPDVPDVVMSLDGDDVVDLTSSPAPPQAPAAQDSTVPYLDLASSSKRKRTTSTASTPHKPPGLSQVRTTCATAIEPGPGAKRVKITDMPPSRHKRSIWSAARSGSGSGSGSAARSFTTPARHPSDRAAAAARDAGNSRRTVSSPAKQDLPVTETDVRGTSQTAALRFRDVAL